MVEKIVEDMRPFFDPKAVAIIGATNKKGKVGNVIFENFRMNKERGIFRGNIYPVNPKLNEIDGYKVYKSVEELPEDTDLAVISIPAPFVPDTMRQIAKKGIKSVIIITGGFGELGEEGKKLEREILEIARENGIRVIGPNCVGVYVPDTGVDTVFLPESKMDRPKSGPIAFVSQSGAFAAAMLDWAAMAGIGIGKMVSYGNKLDVDDADLMDYFIHDDSIKVVTFYIEGVKDGRKFIESAKRVTKVKPVIALKSGRTEYGAKAASSHTGSLAGADTIYDAVFKQTGVIRAEDFEHMFDLAKAFAALKDKLPRGDRIGIITDGGGAGVMASDAVAKFGLKMADLSEETLKFLRENFPPHAVAGNPTDVVGDTDAERYRIAIEGFVNDPNVDAVLVIVLFQVPLLEEEKIIDILAEYQKKSDKPIVAVAMGGKKTDYYAKMLEDRGVPVYPTPERGVRALAGLVKYAEYLRRGA
ncbi:acetate--CoA ligase family protein [Thermococcus thioreducens]|uniref:acetate--CoA ligase (ADP-forming) n=1 Tax=Thermococcus thioreducens TaxID=277988 RepID=A0A0Q2QQS9_9EURY|nr:CoA-binding protein [Thermococcus thioreducens]ASJ12859.1 CoA-binding protein [Thermococcus thioreducens]KQH82325.1 CoA-binding protein [Thermococcus thioreducens]SEV84203.1 acetyl coenzyme A synthetase (ADP forming), alpha domain-containing protein [Thermococcus thioreducens]